jgi:hypothetical protein
LDRRCFYWEFILVYIFSEGENMPALEVVTFTRRFLLLSRCWFFNAFNHMSGQS